MMCEVNAHTKSRPIGKTPQPGRGEAKHALAQTPPRAMWPCKCPKGAAAGERDGTITGKILKWQNAASQDPHRHDCRQNSSGETFKWQNLASPDPHRQDHQPHEHREEDGAKQQVEKGAQDGRRGKRERDGAAQRRETAQQDGRPRVRHRPDRQTDRRRGRQSQKCHDALCGGFYLMLLCLPLSS
jgi:hypothetical protein